MRQNNRSQWPRFGAGLVLGTLGTWAASQQGMRLMSQRRLAQKMGGQGGAKVVILGAGFGGVHVAQELTNLLPPQSDCEITLVDQNNFLLFTPMLTEAAGGQVDTRHVVASVHNLSPRIQFRQGRVKEINVRGRTVQVTLGAPEKDIPQGDLTLEADHLVIALGSVTNFHDLPGLKENSLTVKSLGDAAAIRNRVLELLERADSETDAAKRCALLTVVVGGGGFSGVETMAAVNDLLRDGARHYPSVKVEDVQTILVQPGDRLLPELHGSLASYAQSELEKRGVDVKLKTEISGAGDGYVEIKNGPRIETHLLIWAGGIKPSPVIDGIDCKRGHHGGIVVDGCCAVPDRPGVWALGDCAEIPEPHGGKTYAPTAQNAMREGTLVARNIVALLGGQKPEPFVYTPIGELAIVGKRAGVAKIYGLHFAGLPAWAMWRLIYLAKMPGVSNRVRIAVDWLLDMVFGREITELPVARSSKQG